MHRLSLLVPVLLFLSTGCLKKKEISGRAFVDRDVLVDVLVDLHLMDGITTDRKFYNRYNADSIDVTQPIFEKHGITKAMFDTTMYEYSRYPELLDQVYNEVLVKLNVMLDQNDESDQEDPGAAGRPAQLNRPTK